MDRIFDSLKILPRREYDPGDVIMEEGRPKSALYVLIEGEVEILKKDIQINTVDSPGSIFGDMSVLLDKPHMATVRALQACSFYRVENVLEFLRAHPEVHLHLTRLIARRLNGVTNYLVDIKKQFQEQDDHMGMVDEVLESLVHQQTGTG